MECPAEVKRCLGGQELLAAFEPRPAREQSAEGKGEVLEARGEGGGAPREEGEDGVQGLWTEKETDGDAASPSTLQEPGGRQEESATGHLQVEAAANLLHEHGVSLPEEVGACFRRGFMVPEVGQSVLCEAHEEKVSEIDQRPLLNQPHCLPARAAWRVCQEGKWLCAPTPGVEVPTSLMEVASRADKNGMPGLIPSWVYLAHGMKENVFGADECSQPGAVLGLLEQQQRRVQTVDRAMGTRTQPSMSHLEMREWAHRAEVVANLLHEHGVSLPEEVGACFRRGFMVPEVGQSVLCEAHEVPRSAFSSAVSNQPHCLPALAALQVCRRGKWLCAPTPGVEVPTSLMEVASRADKFGIPGLIPSWVYLAHGEKKDVPWALECSRVGAVLGLLQELWNRRGPLFNAPEGSGSQGWHNLPMLAYLGRSWFSGSEQPKTPPPIAVYVHKRPQYFRQVLASLREVRGVDRVPLLVISMDSVEEQMLAIARSVDFMPVRIIFHPVRADLLVMQPIVAIKMHWMWLQDELWTRIPETKDLDGHIALLEEDHAVTPDYLEVTMLLLDLKARECPQCWAVGVKYGCRDMNDREVYKVCRSHAVMNTGIAFNRSTYEKIKRSDFMGFADGWDWSLFHLAQTGQMADMMLAPAVSRIRNIGMKGATVMDNGDALLYQQLDYKAVGENTTFDHKRFWIDDTVAMHYVPPAWEPLYLGAIRFISP